jgi:hypothetical protein
MLFDAKAVAAVLQLLLHPAVAELRLLLAAVLPREPML